MSERKILSSSSPPPSLKRTGVQLDTDGCLIKRILKEGSGEIPPQKSIVTIHYEGYLSTGILFDSSVQNNTPLTFQLNSNKVVEALDIAILTMKVGEEAEVVSTQKFGFGKHGLPPFIPPNTSIIFKVQLLSFRESGTSNDITCSTNFEQIINKTLKEKEKGTENYQSGEYRKALRHYIKSLWILQDPNVIVTQESDIKKRQDTMIVLYLNIATCHIKLQDGTRAISNCEKILELGGNNAKFYYRMGQAYALNKQFDSAKRSLVQAIRLEPNDKLLRDELESVKLQQQSE
ncbi:hypothetical protein DLAC_00325 [Tieghemostelium lacteum]|uniref:peptidylprolyl isomerase n=1 Tax=Tieghemostelium lacteum TaxID=361077 RepID=A0A152A9P5_TIELA|nr:hypothetical protein DLAC_00325 [Tieghemostelium lacteum]|eukprot:KYR02855.1 hypothetical protein DLAC_00325 [Tieghemostelium lacteum]